MKKQFRAGKKDVLVNIGFDDRCFGVFITLANHRKYFTLYGFGTYQRKFKTTNFNFTLFYLKFNLCVF
jgi:hypothetical protein